MDKFIACDFCDSLFSNRNSMRAHKSKFHRNEKQSSNPFDQPTKDESARSKLWFNSKDKESSSDTSESSSIESNSDSESDLENSDKETSRDALKQFETDVESSEEEWSKVSGDVSDDERANKGVKTSRKILKRRMHKNWENKHMPKNLHSSKKRKIIRPVLMDESSDSSESSESETELPNEDCKDVTDEQLEKDEEVSKLKDLHDDLCKEEIGSINCFMLKYYLCLLENNKSEQQKILKDAPLEFFQSLQILFNCLTTGKINLTKEHGNALKNRKGLGLFQFIRKYNSS